MTTTVTVTHDGPADHHDILVTPTGSVTLQHPTRIHAFESITTYLWNDGALTITEVSKEQKE